MNSVLRNRFTVPLAAAALLLGVAPQTSQAQENEVPISPIVLVDLMTGRDATTNTAETWDVGATDLGVMWDDGDGGVLTFFGDTFTNPGGDGAGNGNWRSNVLLRSTDTDLSDGMGFDWALTNDEGVAVEAFPGLHQFDDTEVTKIPTAGIEVDGVQYATYMSVMRWGDPGEWWTNYSQLAWSADGGETWSIEDAPRWDNNEDYTHPFQMASFAQQDDYLYMYGTPNGRFGALHVARVAEADIMDKDAYRYWDGSAWVADEDQAAEIIEPAVSETSVRYDDYTGLWQIIFLNGDADLVFRTSPTATGPWSEEQILGTQAEYAGLYGGYIHPWSPDGEIYMALSIWNEYQVSLMHFRIDEDGNIIRPNLLVDPSFERSTAFDVPDGWRPQGNAGIDTVSAWTKQGRHQFWVRGDSGEHLVVQAVDVEPNTTYRLRGWLTTGDSVGGDAGEGRIGARVSGPGGQVLEMETFGDLDGWNEFVVDFTTGSMGAIEVFAGSTMTADRWVQGDSFSLVEVGPAGDPDPDPSPAPTASPQPTNGVDRPRPGLPSTGA